MCIDTISTFELLNKFPDNTTARKGNKEGQFVCAHCAKDFSVRTSTVFERSHIPLYKWLYAIYQVITARKEVSSMQLSKELGMVEIDETYIGDKEKTKGTQGRSTKAKTPVVGMRSREGVVKTAKMSKVNSNNIQAMIDVNINKNATLCTDEATVYKGIKGYKQLMANHSAGQYVNGIAHTNGVESIWALLKQGCHGIFHHFSDNHIERYVNEFAFRLNEGNVKTHTWDRMESMIMGEFGRRLTYKRLIEKDIVELSI